MLILGRDERTLFTLTPDRQPLLEISVCLARQKEAGQKIDCLAQVADTCGSDLPNCILATSLRWADRLVKKISDLAGTNCSAGS